MDKIYQYVKLLITVGVHIQPGQKLLIWCPVDGAYFARMAMEEAYKAGAADVVIRWFDEPSDRISCLLAPDSKFDIGCEWEGQQTQYWADEGYRMLWVCAPDPEIFKGVDSERVRKCQAILPGIPWTLAYIPTPPWAAKVFPGAATEEEAMTLLWKGILAACRVTEHNPAHHWRQHMDALQRKGKALSEFDFKYLHMKNGLGTDVTLELPRGHVWITCTGETEAGGRFMTNIPTEEVFTAPLRTGVNGIAYATRPLLFMGEAIDGFWLRFKNGRVVEYAAKQNQHLLETLLTSHENADFLGEVALVPHSSPISQLGLLWYDSSFDENASCHLALGGSYPQTLMGADCKSEDERLAMGLNQCFLHEDFMIGTADMDVTGVTQEGKEILILKQGEWMI